MFYISFKVQNMFKRILCRRSIQAQPNVRANPNKIFYIYIYACILDFREPNIDQVLTVSGFIYITMKLCQVVKCHQHFYFFFFVFTFSYDIDIGKYTYNSWPVYKLSKLAMSALNNDFSKSNHVTVKCYWHY